MLHDPYSETAFITGDCVHRFHLRASSQPALPATIRPQGFYHPPNLFPHVRFAANHGEQLRLDFIWREAKPREVQAGHENLMIPSLAHGA